MARRTLDGAVLGGKLEPPGVSVRQIERGQMGLEWDILAVYKEDV